MFEEITYESKLQEMLDRLPDGIDVREGSVMWNALAPVAYEVVALYLQLDLFLKNSYGDTAEREFLLLLGKDRSMVPMAATPAILLGKFDVDVSTGSRFSIDGKVFYTAELIEQKDGLFYYRMIAEVPGKEGNFIRGHLLPLQNFYELKVSEVAELLKPGEDEESTEDFRKRYLKSLNNPAYGGNISDYTEKVEAIDGVGRCKVFPVWNGGGTVKVVFQNADFLSPSVELVDTVQNALDPKKEGQGYGLAPIGHVVTVEGVISKPIAAEITLLCEEGTQKEEVLKQIEEGFESYLHSLRLQWADRKYLVVRKSMIEAMLTRIKGVLDLVSVNLSVQNAGENFRLMENEIPVFEEISRLELQYE